MKKIFSFLLITALLLSFTITARADDENTGNTGTDSSSQIIVVPSEDDLPEGYEIDPDYSFTFTIDAESGWTYTLEDLIASDDNGDYIYFIVEEDVAKGYTPEYSQNYSGSAKRSRAGTNSSEGSQGNVVVVKNIKEGDGPTYELPQTGGIGTTIYTVLGTAVLLIAAVYGIILFRRKRKSA